MPLRITIELIPHGDESRKSKIAVVDIENDRTGTSEFGNYIVQAVGNCVVDGEPVGWDEWGPTRIVGIKRGDYLLLARKALKALTI